MGFLVFIGIAFVVFLVVKSSRVSQLNGAFRRLEARYRGYQTNLHRGGLFSLPYLRMVYNDAHVLVDIWYAAFSSAFASHTQFHISWPDHQMSMRLKPAKWRDRVGRRLGSSHIPLPNQYYNKRYQVSGNDPTAVQLLLTGGALSVIDQMAVLGLRDDISLEIEDGILILRKRGVIRDYNLLRRFTSLGLEFFDQAMISRSHGIDIIEEQYEVDYKSDAICKICGEQIYEDIVYCRKCNTPHHMDCWSYYGSCSVYGCGESSFSRAVT